MSWRTILLVQGQGHTFEQFWFYLVDAVGNQPVITAWSPQWYLSRSKDIKNHTASEEQRQHSSTGYHLKGESDCCFLTFTAPKHISSHDRFTFTFKVLVNLFRPQIWLTVKISVDKKKKFLIFLNMLPEQVRHSIAERNKMLHAKFPNCVHGCWCLDQDESKRQHCWFLYHYNQVEEEAVERRKISLSVKRSVVAFFIRHRELLFNKYIILI